ncbi:MAG TPA: TetR family transcriptional regulator, partial [Lapillicoccus sp.]|nr:TetR family transcriptional regulator [Lapillicoccus sp.]
MTATPPPARRGPRPAGEDTRARITEAARSEFADKGYEGTSMRSVARVAGVDPALVHHYFDGKADLFAQAVVMTRVNPAMLV